MNESAMPVGQPTNVQETGPGALTVGDLLQMVRRRPFLLAGVAAVVCAGVFIALMRQTPMFQAEASLAIDRGRKAVRFAEADDQGRIEFSLLNTYRDMILSRPVMDAALNHSGIGDEFPFNEATDPVGALTKRVSVSTSRDSWVIKLQVEDETPERAERLAAVIMDRFIDQQNRQQMQRAEVALSFSQPMSPPPANG